MKNILPWDIANKHPVTILVFVSSDNIGTSHRINQLPLIHVVPCDDLPVVKVLNIFFRAIERSL